MNGVSTPQAKGNTVALKKAVKDIMEALPPEASLYPVHGAAVIGLHMVQKDKILSPEVTFWSQLKPEYVVLMLKEILTKLEADLALNRKAAN